MMRAIIIFIFCTLAYTSKAQDGSMLVAATAGYTHNNIPSVNLGLAYGYAEGYYHLIWGHGIVADILIPTTENRIWGTRLGVEGFISILPLGLGARADMIRYTDLKSNSEWHFSPSLGLSIGILNFMYAYSFPFQDSDNIDVQRHQFTTRVSIPIFHYRPKKWSK
jgi:hypothetical protein